MRLKILMGLVAVALAIGLIAWLVSSGPGVAPIAPIPEGPDASPSPAPLAASRPAPRASSTRPIRSEAFDTRSEPPAAAAEGGRGAVLVHVVWGDDKTPAAGVALRVWNAPDVIGVMRGARTGDDGAVLLENLRPGPIVVYTDRGAANGVDVVARETKEVTIEIRPGVTVTGLVIDGDRSPVGGAEILLSTMVTGAWSPAGTSDAKGEFVLRCLPVGHSIAACARGFAPSTPCPIRAGMADGRVTLRISERAGAVRGIAKAPDGAPVAGAQVRVLLTPALAAETDGAGAFTIESVPAGTHPVAVRAPGFAPWSGSATVKVGETTATDVVLRREAVVVGAVLLPSGGPASRANVIVGSYGDFLSSWTRTDEDGSFRLPGLPAGKNAIQATAKGAGKAEAELELIEGAEVRWDAVIEGGLKIFGVVRDEREQPVPEWVVLASVPPRGGWEGSAVSGPDGRFAIVNCPASPSFRITAFARNARTHSVELDDVVADGTELVIHVSSVALGTIKGRVVDAEGKPAAATIRVALKGKGSTDHSFETKETTADSGTFTIGPVMPGKWRIWIEPKPYGTLDLGEIAVEPGATLDLGDVKLETMGSLAIDLSGPADAVARTSCNILRDDPYKAGRSIPWNVAYQVGQHALGKPLPLGPGKYWLNLMGAGIVPQAVRFEIAAGRETRLALTVEAGVRCEFRFSFPAGADTTAVSFAILSPAGAHVRSGYAPSNPGIGPASSTIVLTGGEYRLDATTSGGLRVSKEFTVSSNGAAQTIEVALERDK